VYGSLVQSWRSKVPKSNLRPACYPSASYMVRECPLKHNPTADRWPDPVHNLNPSSSHKDIRIGFPKLPLIGSQSYFELMRLWLEDCDRNHPGCRPISGIDDRLPTRLIDVGGKENDGTVRLYVTRPEDVGHMQSFRYIALSHQWGDPTLHNHFNATPENIDVLTEGISESLLPPMFQNAIRFTRELNVRYLWIDSICIIQGPEGDFANEAQYMETVFHLAYCVIAASHSSGTSTSFLRPQQDRTPRKFVKFGGSPSGSPVYVCEPFDDFEHDIVNGPLNKRGWVLQERALAQRTIHIADTQTYWECGEGVRCETLTKMRKYVQPQLLNIETQTFCKFSSLGRGTY